MTDQDDIRSMLERRASDISPRPDPADLERRLSGSRRPDHGRRLALLVAAVLLVLVGAVALVIVDRRVDDHVRTAGEPETATTSVVTETTVGPTTTTAPETTTTIPSTTTTSPTTTTTIVATFDVDTPVTISGFGQLDMGIDLTEANAQHGLSLALDPAEVMPDTDCGYLPDVFGIPALWIMLDGDRLVRVDIEEGSPVRTDRGIGIGDGQAGVLAAYPEATVADGPYGGFDLTVLDPARPDMKMIFQTDGTRVVAFRSGLADFVDWSEGCA